MAFPAPAYCRCGLLARWLPRVTPITCITLLQLAEELGSVSKACKMMGCHGDPFYEVERAFQVGGVQSLIDQKHGPRGPHTNRVPEQAE
jgi:hypothetical protein